MKNIKVERKLHDIRISERIADRERLQRHKETNCIKEYRKCSIQKVECAALFVMVKQAVCLHNGKNWHPIG